MQQTQMQQAAGISNLSSFDLRDEIKSLREDNKTLRDDNKTLREDNKTLREDNKSLRDELKMRNIPTVEEANAATETEATETEVRVSNNNVGNDLISSKKSMSIEAVVKYWYMYDYANVYQRYVDNPDAMITNNEKSVMSDYSRIVSVVNLFLDSHIQKTEDERFSEESIRIRKNMYVAVKAAVDNMMKLFEESGLKVTTGNFVKKVKSSVRDGKLVLPQGPPGVCLYDIDSGDQAKKKIMTYDKLMESFTGVKRSVDAEFGREFGEI